MSRSLKHLACLPSGNCTQPSLSLPPGGPHFKNPREQYAHMQPADWDIALGSIPNGARKGCRAIHAIKLVGALLDHSPLARHAWSTTGYLNGTTAKGYRLSHPMPLATGQEHGIPPEGIWRIKGQLGIIATLDHIGWMERLLHQQWPASDAHPGSAL